MVNGARRVQSAGDLSQPCWLLGRAVQLDQSQEQHVANHICFPSYTGKQARSVHLNDDTLRKDELQSAAANDPKMHITDPMLNQGVAAPQEPSAAYSEAPGDAQNRAARAGNAAAHHNEAAQDLKTSKKRVDDASLAKIIAEENASKAKFPNYPGLDRWELIEKMGDGAFSNVYRARDLQGDAGEVAIKVVRKYEMNSMQVSGNAASGVYTSPFDFFIALVCFVHVSLLFSFFLCVLFIFCVSCFWQQQQKQQSFTSVIQTRCFLAWPIRFTLIDLYQPLGFYSFRETNTCTRNSKRGRKQQRCAKSSPVSNC